MHGPDLLPYDLAWHRRCTFPCLNILEGFGAKRPQGDKSSSTSCTGGTGARSADAARCANRRAREVPVHHVDKRERGDLSQPKPRGRTTVRSSARSRSLLSSVASGTREAQCLPRQLGFRGLEQRKSRLPKSCLVSLRGTYRRLIPAGTHSMRESSPDRESTDSAGSS